MYPTYRLGSLDTSYLLLRLGPITFPEERCSLSRGESPGGDLPCRASVLLIDVYIGGGVCV